MSAYLNINSDPEIRLSRAKSYIEELIRDGTISSVGDFTSYFKQFTTDLYKSPKAKELTRTLYVTLIKDDMQKLVQLYTDEKYSSSLLDQDKKSILNGFFDGAKDDLIIEALLPTSSPPLHSTHVRTISTATKLALHKMIVQELANIDAGNKPNLTAIEKIIDDYGFRKWIKEQDTFANPFTSSPDELFNEIAGSGDLASVTAAQKGKLDTIKNAVRGTKGLPPAGELTPDEQRNLNQCALISDLIHKGDSYELYPALWADPNTAGPNKCFNGRIYPVTIGSSTSPFNPDSLVNMCTIPKTVKSFFNKATSIDGVVWNLYWVFTDKDGIKEEKIFKTNKSPVEGAYIDKLAELKAGGWLTVDLDKKDKTNKKLGTTEGDITHITKNINGQRKGYTITGIDITYEGTNPSTARNDVKLTMKIKLDSLLALQSTCCYAALKTNVGGKARSERLEVKISDLVAGPQTNTYETDVIAQGTIKREFIPDFSRIRLKVRTGESELEGSDLILDLATINHEISTPSETGVTEMTISYRGYFEQAMNMPYNDALADDTLIASRQARAKRIKDAKLQKCSDKLIREIGRINSEQERLEVEAFHEAGGLVKRIYDSGRVWKYFLDKQKLQEGTNGNVLDPRIKYTTKFEVPPTYYMPNGMQHSQWDMVLDQAEQRGASGAGKELAMNAIAYIKGTENKQSKKDTLELALENNAFGGGISYNMALGGGSGAVEYDFSTGHCFYLGDLMNLLLDCLYDTGTADHKVHAKGMNLRFIVGTIRVPDPNDLTNYITINPLQIPIDMSFFASWYHDTIVKKGITHYPVGAFMRDLIERLINDVIYDTCFGVLLPDEAPPQLRTTYFTDCDNGGPAGSSQWFGTFNSATTLEPPNGEWFDPNTPYSDGSVQKPNILMKKISNVEIKNCNNYCVIYQQSPSYFRQLKAQRSFKLSDDPYCPTMYYGYNMKNLNYLTSMTLKRSDSTYLKEARFFSSQLGNLSLLSNIYDLDFEIKEKKINTMFFPGNIINLIITDFEGGSDTKFVSIDAIAVNESNPHKKATLANTLGIGGYHIIKSVTYKLDNKTTKNITISISTKFSGTDATDDQDRDSSKTPKAQEQAACITQYNNALGALRKTEVDTGLSGAEFDRNTEVGAANGKANGSTSSQTERHAEIDNGVMLPATPMPLAVPLAADDLEVVAAAQADIAKKAAAVTAAGDSKTILANKYTYNQVSAWQKGKSINGARINKDKYNDHFLEIKTIKPDKVNQTATIEWNVFDKDDKIVETFTSTHKNKEP